MEYMVVLHRGSLPPGRDAVSEYQVKTAEIAGDAETYADITFTLEGAYSAAPAIACTPQRTPGAGSAATMIAGFEVLAASTAAITVRVHQDAAPGEGIADTITIAAYIAGPQR